jgi:hypothetical protein
MATMSRQSVDALGATLNLEPLNGLLDRVKSRLNPSAIWLFGSRARGDAGALSDWDLLVVVPDDCAEVDDPLAAWKIATASDTCCDLILCRASEFHEDSNTPNTLTFEAAHHGVLLYER